MINYMMQSESERVHGREQLQSLGYAFYHRESLGFKGSGEIRSSCFSSGGGYDLSQNFSGYSQVCFDKRVSQSVNLGDAGLRKAQPTTLLQDVLESFIC